jgi:thiosulfate sulfurtransferase
MNPYKQISPQQAQELIARGGIHLVDIRDQHAYQMAHIKTAINLNNANVEQFILDAPKELPLIIYCYHGNSSQQAGQFFSEQGFSEVYSLEGGFDLWSRLYPETLG